MKVAIIGATGFLGKKLVNEFTNRNHQVTAISRTVEESDKENLQYVAVDVLNIEKLSKVLKGHDAVVSSFNPGWTNPNIYNDFLAGAKAIQEAVKLSGVKRLITIGGAGSLYINGSQLVDSPDFPADFKQGATAAREYLDIIKEEKELDWAFFSPAIEMHPGITTGRTGNYRLGLENPVFDDENRSILSGEDVAVVLADEVENPRHHQVRFTSAY
ncbi:putative NADH-flavin reductase [Flavobacterium arsenatis]|uniref:NADH-flavin reductase n=1 Tax=Flavobacterium arsenatis TaxID=1484332 RepID=A0ABU1TSE1_9FLAO|nr:NAD(P)H-binding protein [Flavobacterium arsenatis]MDR6968805.1 putative NADH-flavin reductase [Flavobacterium arsenatis]